MRASTSVQTTPGHSAYEWGKRRRSRSTSENSNDAKRARNYFIKLEDESSNQSDTGTESIYSIQGKETDYAKDTSDTDTKSELSDEYDIQVEYEVATESEEEQVFSGDSTSDPDALVAASIVVSTIIDETTIDIWATDEGDESDSVSPILGRALKDAQTCRMCKERETQNGFPLCSHCHQIRKTYFPPRPRKRSRKKNQLLGQSSSSLSQLSTESLSLNQMSSQDSGIQVDSALSNQMSSQDSGIHVDSALSNPMSPQGSDIQIDSALPNKNVKIDGAWSDWALAIKGMCIMCNEKPKNGIFLHTYGGHMCCCYKCAVKYWNKSKRCAYCNQKVKNVLRAFVV